MSLDPHLDTRVTKIAADLRFELVSSGFRPFIGSYELSRSTSLGGSDLADAVPGWVFLPDPLQGKEPSEETDLLFLALWDLGGTIEVLLDDS